MFHVRKFVINIGTAKSGFGSPFFQARGTQLSTMRNGWGASPVDLTVHWVPLLYTRAGHESKTSCSLLLSRGSEGSNPDGRSIYLLVCFHFY